MKTLKSLIISVLLIIYTDSISAQENELYVINETNSTFQNFALKISNSKTWEDISVPQETEEYLQAFTITIDTSQNCLIDFKANDGSVEYMWYKVDLCGAIEVSLYLDDNGKTAYMVSYAESEDEVEVNE